MKLLQVLRHSLAGQTKKGLPNDHERPLTEKGVELCRYVGEYIKETRKIPELILTSTAKRAKETADFVIKSSGHKIKTRAISKLYLASPDDILDIVNDINDNISSIMIVGHNPGLQRLSIELSGEGDKAKYRKIKSGFPPASLVTLSFSCKWDEIAPRKGKLVDFTVGKSLKRSGLSASRALS